MYTKCFVCFVCYVFSVGQINKDASQNKTETYILSNTLYTKSKYTNQTQPTQIKRTLYTNISILDAQKHNIEIDPRKKKKKGLFLILDEH
jgi:hypothetical protein